MNGRVYDPVIGRFGSPDPATPDLHSTQSWNRYSYAANNPLKYVDPTGHEESDAGESEGSGNTSTGFGSSGGGGANNPAPAANNNAGGDSPEGGTAGAAAGAASPAQAARAPEFSPDVATAPATALHLVADVIPMPGASPDSVPGADESSAALGLVEMPGDSKAKSSIPGIHNLMPLGLLDEGGRFAKAAAAARALALRTAIRTAVVAVAATAALAAVALAASTTSTAGPDEDKGPASAPEDKKSQHLLYRGGARDAYALTPRPVVDPDGLSAYDTAERAAAPGRNVQVIDATKLQMTWAKPDPDDPGHYGIVPGMYGTPPNPAQIAAWAATKGGPVTHPYTLDVMSAVIATVKVPK